MEIQIVIQSFITAFAEYFAWLSEAIPAAFADFLAALGL